MSPPAALSPNAVRSLVEQHRRFLRFVQRRVGSRHEAEDILHDAFATVLARGGSLREEESVTAWFYRILRNAIAAHYRRGAARRRALRRLPTSGVVDAGFDRELERVVCRCVTLELAALKPVYATVLRRCDVDGRPVAAVAGELGISPGSARVRLHRARRALRDRLRLVCGTCVDHGCLDCSCSRTVTLGRVVHQQEAKGGPDVRTEPTNGWPLGLPPRRYS